MVAPISGPFYKTVAQSNYHSTCEGWKQAKPHDLVLPYKRGVAFNYVKVGPQNLTPVDSVAWSAELPPDQALIGSAYEKLKGMVSDRASLGVSLLELDQSITMITNRSVQIARFGRQLLRGNLVGAAKELRLSAVPKRASVKKSFSNNYLEFHFGWAPLIGDIHSAIDVLQSPVKDCTPKATAKSGMSDWYNLSNPGKIDSTTQKYESYRRFRLQRRVTMGARVSVSNPNLWLANQLGLVNPAVLVYELIPFSFVADWFINVEQFLSQGTDYYGLTLDKTYTTRIDKGEFSQRLWDDKLYSGYYGPNGAWVSFWGYSHSDVNSNICNMWRQSGLAKPALFVRPFKVWGWRRAAAAVSLLTQQLAKK